MKTLPSALAAHIATRDTTLATALRITRADATVFGFTTHDCDAIISGVTYRANPGLEITDIQISANAAVGNLELTTLHDGTIFTTPEILGGAWRNAAFQIFRYNYASIADGTDTLLVGTLGDARILQNKIVVELRDLRQYLQQSVGSVSSKTCRARLGDARCAKDVSAFTATGAVTLASDDGTSFQDTSQTEGDTYFDEGEIRFLTGANAGRSAKVKTFLSAVFVLATPMYCPIVVGDTYRAIAGCRKRLEEDCFAKFNNVLNFQGEPHRKGQNDLTKNVVPR